MKDAWNGLKKYTITHGRILRMPNILNGMVI